MEVVLDSNFVISCVKRKIDFISQLEEMGFKIVMFREVLQEMKDLRLDVAREERVAIDIGLMMIEKNKVKKEGMSSGAIDEQLIKKGKSGAYIATLDKGIRRVVPNKIIISNATNGLEIERN